MTPTDPPDAPSSRAPARGRTALVVAGAYAALVILVSVFEALYLYLPPEVTGLQDAPILIWLILVTLPYSLVFLLLVDSGPEWLNTVLYHSLTLGGLLQAWLLWRALRAITARRSARGGPRPR